MAHSETDCALPCEVHTINTTRKRKVSGAASSDPSPRRVKPKNSTNGNVARVLCPLYIRNPMEPCKANSCWITGFSEIAKMRDHLKDVHDLPKDLLDKLNFKGGRFRSLKTIEEKWKCAFNILFPEVAKDNIPAPFKNNYYEEINDCAKKLPAFSGGSKPSITDENSRQSYFDFTLLPTTLQAKLQNWLFDRLQVDKNVPISTKLDILADFGTAFAEVVGAPGGKPDFESSATWKPMAPQNTLIGDLELDWALLSTNARVPDFEIADEQPVAGPIYTEPNQGYKVEKVTNMDDLASYETPNSKFIGFSPLYDTTDNVTSWNVFPTLTNGFSLSMRHQDSKPMSIEPVIACQLPTPPATPSSCHSPVNLKTTLAPLFDEGNTSFAPPTNFNLEIPAARTPSVTFEAASDDFNMHDYIGSYEDEHYYYLSGLPGFDDNCNGYW